MTNHVEYMQVSGADEFTYYNQTLGPDEVIFPQQTIPGDRRYGVTVHRSAWQWEIVAVEFGRTRHVAFISSVLRLDQVLGLASGMASSLASVVH